MYARITQLAREGDALARKGAHPEAVRKYVVALELLPQPVTNWEACTWLLTAIGDSNFLAGRHEYAIRALGDAMACPGALGNPFIHMRLGQAQFEQGNMQRAADELARAYLQEGVKIFAREDPKYLVFIKSKLDPPPGGWPPGW